MGVDLEYRYHGRGQIRNTSSSLLNEIEVFNNDFIGVPWGQKIYNYLNNISIQPKCSCGKPLKFFKFNKGYSRFCSNDCRYKSDELKEDIKNSYTKRFGVDNPLKSKEIQDKRREYFLKKHGVEHQSQLKEVIEKKRNTNLKKYGVTTNLLHSETIEKRSNTIKEKYGVDHPSQSTIIKEKRRETNLERYGVGCNLTLPEVRIIRRKKDAEKYRKEISEKLNVDFRKISIDENGDVIFFDFCLKHKEFKISKQILYARLTYEIENFCTECFPVRDNNSIKEKDFKDFFNSINIKKVRNTKKIIPPKEIDIYFPDNNVGVEFNGLYWHSDSFKEKNYHQKKTEQCEDVGVDLVHVFEDEWVYKKEIVESIVKAKLGFFDEKIFARKCEVRPITPSVEKKFLIENHIQGYSPSSIKLGLYHEDDLVSVMTFGKPRKSLGSNPQTDGAFEMIRYCNKKNTIVVGGAEKLFSYFIKNNNPKKITTFADRRYFTGNIYIRLGFKFIENTRPNYWYFTRNQLVRHHRYGFRKDLLVRAGFDEKKSETVIMKERGYYRIYDCGNKKFEITF
jgi:hypothetical protein